jgi:site-specific recombinase XerD
MGVSEQTFYRWKKKYGGLGVAEVRRLFDSITLDSIKDFRDRALLGVLFYAWVRVSAACKLDVGDYYHVGRNSFLRFKEKGGKEHTIPAHKAVEYLDTYLTEAGIDANDRATRKELLFRTLDRRRKLTHTRVHRNDVFRMLRVRALAAGITADITVHSARATGITTYLENGGQLEAAQDIANHADPRTTRLYDRRQDRLDRAEIERVQY